MRKLLYTIQLYSNLISFTVCNLSILIYFNLITLLTIFWGGQNNTLKHFQIFLRLTNTHKIKYRKPAQEGIARRTGTVLKLIIFILETPLNPKIVHSIGVGHFYIFISIFLKEKLFLNCLCQLGKLFEYILIGHIELIQNIFYKKSILRTVFEVSSIKVRKKKENSIIIKIGSEKLI